jgi:hypothetical protein
MDPRTPVAFGTSARCSFVSGAFNPVSVPFDSSKLLNTYRTPIEVREILVNTITYSYDGKVDASYLTYLEGKFGQNYITDGPTPIALLSPHKVDATGQGDIHLIENSDPVYVACRRIILPKPLYLPSGKGFSFVASIQPSEFTTKINTLGYNFDVDVFVGIVGRFLTASDPRPKSNLVPMFSHAEMTQNRRISIETELRNPLTKPLRVKRLIGVSPRWGTVPGSMINVNGYESYSTGTEIEFKLPDGSPLSEDAIDFKRGIFGQMRVMPCDFELPANSRIRAQIGVNASENGGIAGIIGYQVALFGTREEMI